MQDLTLEGLCSGFPTEAAHLGTGSVGVEGDAGAN